VCTSSVFQIETDWFVAPAIKAPSGVNANATTPEPIVIEHFGFVSGDRAFQILIAPSSPADASNRSVSSLKIDEVGNGCQAKVVIWPW
jgi:hypothetical protein